MNKPTPKVPISKHDMPRLKKTPHVVGSPGCCNNCRGAYLCVKTRCACHQATGTSALCAA